MFDFDGGIKFIMDKELLETAKPITVDISYMGFTVDSSLPSSGGSCSSGSCSSGGCGSEGSCCS